MAKKKEMENLIRISLAMDKNMIEKLDELAKETNYTRSRLIRLGCIMLIEDFKDHTLTDSRKEKIINILKLIFKKNKWKYKGRDDELKEMINHAYEGLRCSFLHNPIKEEDGLIHIFAIDDNVNIMSSDPNFLNGQDIAIINEVIRIIRVNMSLLEQKKYKS